MYQSPASKIHALSSSAAVYPFRQPYNAVSLRVPLTKATRENEKTCPRACAPTTHIAFQSHTGKLGQPPPIRQNDNSQQQRSTSEVSRPRIAAADPTQWCHSTTQHPHRTSTSPRSVVISLTASRPIEALPAAKISQGRWSDCYLGLLGIAGSSISLCWVPKAQPTSAIGSQIAVLWPPLGACSKMSEGARLVCWAFGVADLSWVEGKYISLAMPFLRRSRQSFRPVGLYQRILSSLFRISSISLIVYSLPQ